LFASLGRLPKEIWCCVYDQTKSVVDSLDFCDVLAALLMKTEKAAARVGELCVTPEEKVRMANGYLTSYNQDHRLIYEELARNNSRFPAPGQIPFCLEWTGPLDVTCLNEALRSLIRRHGTLRTVLASNDEIPPLQRQIGLRVFASRDLTTPGLYRQAVLPEVEMTPVSVFDVGETGCPNEATQALLEQDLNGPFDYTKPPLLRARLLRTGPQKHLLLLVLPAVICDLWSLRIIHLELVRLYDEALSPGLSRIAPPAFQFHQFVRQQYEQARTGQFDGDIQYWKGQWSEFARAQIFSREIPFAQVPPGPPRIAIQRLQLSPEETLEIRKFAGGARLSVRSVVLAGFAGWLARVFNKPKVALMTACRNRMPQHEGTIGWFSNSHLIGLDAPAGAPIQALAPTAHRALLEAEGHQSVPPPFLWNRLGRRSEQGDLGVTFTFIPAADDPVVTQDGILVRARPVPEFLRMRSPTSLALMAIDQDEGLLLSVTYSRSRFHAADMQDMLGTLGKSLGGVAGRSGQTVDRLRTTGLHG
jgi:Condensation domain